MAVGAALASPTASASTAESDFCSRMIVANVPLFTGVEPEQDGRLGFGPASIAMGVRPRLVPVGGRVGYELVLRRGAEPAHPHWRVRANLSRFHPRKDLHVFVRGMERQVRNVSPNRSVPFFFVAPDEPAYYMVSASFTTLNGHRKLGHFRLYFRVIHPARDARLVLYSDSYKAGQTVLGRIENHGTEQMSYGAQYRIERYDGAGWSLAPESPRDFILPLYGAFPGESGSDCSRFQIPPSMAPGRYRMTKEVNFGRQGPGGTATAVAAEFDIVP